MRFGGTVRLTRFWLVVLLEGLMEKALDQSGVGNRPDAATPGRCQREQELLVGDEVGGREDEFLPCGMDQLRKTRRHGVKLDRRPRPSACARSGPQLAAASQTS